MAKACRLIACLMGFDRIVNIVKLYLNSFYFLLLYFHSVLPLATKIKQRLNIPSSICFKNFFFALSCSLSHSRIHSLSLSFFSAFIFDERVRAYNISFFFSSVARHSSHLFWWHTRRQRHFR